MLIGKLVKDHISKIFEYCETQDRDELFNLLNKEYSKRLFNINFPFCKEVNMILEDDEYVRFWKTDYEVRNKTIRVCSQWVINSKDLFLDYLLSKNIINEQEFEHYQKIVLKNPIIRNNINPIRIKSKQEIPENFDSIHYNIEILKENSQNQKYDSKISLELRSEAQQMSKHYEVFYSLERSIRNLIVVAMIEKYGENWWDNKVSFEIKRSVNSKIEYELGSVLTKQSDRKIDYTTFGELRKIITTNWMLFSSQFNKDKTAFNRIMTDLNKLRNPIAHCTPLIEKEVSRLDITVDDWFELLKK